MRSKFDDCLLEYRLKNQIQAAGRGLRKKA
jgi:hypothetical protein